MTYGHTNVPNGKGYNAAWDQLSKHVPTVRDLDKAARSAAVWMAQNWDAIDTWLRDTTKVSPQERLKMNHPTVVKRRYDAAHQPKPDTTSPPRENNAQTIIRLQEELDAARKRSGGGLMPSATATEVADAIFEAHNAAFARRLIDALAKRLEAEERQDAIEAKRAKAKPAKRTSGSAKTTTPPA